ncbi:MAG: capsular polysaccharide export protein, LipB/KpsS family, partial [Paracoccaceae bacterium]
YDPSQESRLERYIAATVNLPESALYRAEKLLTRIVRTGLSKYNLDADPLSDLPAGHKILVPGQVEDDASVLLGCSDIKTNLDLLARTRAENPKAVILYKPHPDVAAGLRKGKVEPNDALKYANQILNNADPIKLIEAVDEIWTMTSTLGFEALLRGKKVCCLGVPFYAGWGLTTDLVATPARRNARPTITAFIHACLIDYPRYLDPVTGLACPIEVVLDRLEYGPVAANAPFLRGLAVLQSIFRSFVPLWRR